MSRSLKKGPFVETRLLQRVVAMNEAGKIQKYKMREEAVELLGLQEAASIETA